MPNEYELIHFASLFISHIFSGSTASLRRALPPQSLTLTDVPLPYSKHGSTLVA